MTHDEILTVPFRDLLAAMGLTQSECSRRFEIPWRTIAHWTAGDRQCPSYVRLMMAEIMGIGGTT